MISLGLRILDKSRGRGGYGVVIGLSRSGDAVIVLWPDGKVERMASRNVWVAR